MTGTPLIVIEGVTLLASRRIYHITHVDNLPSVVAAGGLYSDRVRAQQNAGQHTIGMNTIKSRRMALPVHVHSGTFVGDFVPFYFCLRSIMLYVIHRANHPELEYRGGQESIVHLSAQLTTVVTCLTSSGVCWAFSFGNAAANYTRFSADPGSCVV